MAIRSRVPPDSMLKSSEVAKILGVTPHSVDRWIRDNRISALRTLGGHYRIVGHEVNRLLEASEIEGKGSWNL